MKRGSILSWFEIKYLFDGLLFILKCLMIWQNEKKRDREREWKRSDEWEKKEHENDLKYIKVTENIFAKYWRVLCDVFCWCCCWCFFTNFSFFHFSENCLALQFNVFNSIFFRIIHGNENTFTYANTHTYSHGNHTLHTLVVSSTSLRSWCFLFSVSSSFFLLFLDAVFASDIMST